jgi:hypothetical protein
VLIGTTFRELGDRERFAVETWLKTPGIEVLFLGESTRDGFLQIVTPRRRLHYLDVPKRGDRVPRFDKMVEYAAIIAIQHDQALTCIMNADIYIQPEQIPFIEDYLIPRAKPFLAVGQRIEADGTYLPPCGCDYFIMPTTYAWEIKIPPFAIGRCTFDNWMMYNALQTGVPLIDLTRVFDVYHQKHPESAASRLGQDAQENLRLCRQSYPDWNPRKGWVSEATERPTKEEVYGLSRIRSSDSVSHLPASG